MALLNTQERFGTLTKLTHWTIFVLFVTEFYLVYQRENFADGAPEKLQYILLHKSIGFTLLCLALLMVLFRVIGTRPRQIGSNPREIKLAKSIHHLLYLVLFLQPITGMLMSQFAGYPVSVFGLFSIEGLVAKNESIAGLLHETHEWTSYAIIALVSIHALAALFHHFVRKDNVLRRMLF